MSNYREIELQVNATKLTSNKDSIMGKIDRFFNLRDQLEKLNVRLMELYEPVLRDVTTNSSASMISEQKLTGPSLLSNKLDSLADDIEKQILSIENTMINHCDL